jgi:hypothetical protein
MLRRLKHSKNEVVAPKEEEEYDIYHCCVYSETLLMMDRGTVRNM